MPEALKNVYNKSFFDQLRPAFEKALPLYNHDQFLKSLFNREWKNMELKQRVRHVALTLHAFLPESYSKAVRQLVEASSLLRQDKKKVYGYFCIFFCDYVEVYGLNYFDESMMAMEELTQLSSAEFCIRQFILKYPKKTMSQLLKWSKHDNEHVRRLSSEGCRPRLPWAIALNDFKKDPSPVLPILENLKEDESEYVRRSVANNLNDIAKDHPDLVLKIVKQWQGKHPYTDAIIKHGCRTLLKKGNQEVLRSLGYDGVFKISVNDFKVLKQKIKIGETQEFAFELMLKDKKPANLRIEYAVDYLKSKGSHNRKVFKITEGKFEPGKKYSFLRRQRFTDFTTRKHYPGMHHISLLINGKEFGKCSFQLR